MTTLQLGTARATATRPLIAVPVMGTTVNEVLGLIEQANETTADVIEWRLDYLASLAQLTAADMQTITFNADKPLILTWRTQEEGGERAFDPALYHFVYSLGIQAHVAAIDIEQRWLPELRQLKNDAQQQGVQVIGSYHNFVNTPVALADVFTTLATQQVDIIKVAVTPQSPDDVMRLLTTTQQFAAAVQQPLITMAMGTLGTKTRVVGHQYGSQLTFASLSAASAPGQLDLMTLQQQLGESDD